MASVNRVHLLGNAGRDCETRYLPNGKAVANVSIATTSKWKGGDGEMHEETQWHRVTFFDRLAEIAGEYVKKGSSIYVEGSIKYGKYTDKDGAEKNTVDIMATSLRLLGSKDRQEPQAPRPSHDAAKARQTTKPGGASGFDDFEDPPF